MVLCDTFEWALDPGRGPGESLWKVVSLGTTKRRSKEPAERTVTEYETPKPNTHKLMERFRSACVREQLCSGTKRDYFSVMICKTGSSGS